LGISRAVGRFLAEGFETSGNVAVFSERYGDGIGEYDLSENVVRDEIGEVEPPQPKKEPSLEVPGDLGGKFGNGFCMVVLESSESF